MKKCILLITLFFAPLYSMNVFQDLSETPQNSIINTISRENAWLVHVSPIFPQGGTLIPGSLGLVNKDVTSLPEFWTQDLMRNRAIAYMSYVRNTIHWSVNSMVYPHNIMAASIDGRTVEGSMNREAYSYGIVEPMSVFQDKHLAGYWQDVYHFGPHSLSNQSVIFVPWDDTSFESYKGTFSGTIHRYEGSLRNAIEQFLRSKNVSIMYPTQNGQKSDKIIVLQRAQEKPPVFLEDKIIASSDVSQMLRLDNIYHAETPIVAIEKALGFLFEPIRQCRLIEYSQNCFDRIEVQGDLVCAQCRKSAHQISQKTLQRCSGCKVAHYCSQDCQRAHWKASHKRRCALLAKQNLQYLDLYAQYFVDYENAHKKTNFYGGLKALLETYFTKLNEIYTMPQDRQQIDYYHRLVKLLISHFYSDEEKYPTLRSEYNITTQDGFKKYCQYLEKQVDTLRNSAASRSEA